MPESKNPKSVEFEATLLLTLPPSCWSTSGHMPWFWFTSDGHYSFYDGNNNFNAILMIVIIILGTQSPNSVLMVVWQPQQEVSELTSKVRFTSQWSVGHCSCHFLGELLLFDCVLQYLCGVLAIFSFNSILYLYCLFNITIRVI